MRRFRRLWWLGALIALPVVVLVSGRAVPPAHGAMALVKTSPARILTTSGGMTLYVFAEDKKGASACSGKCAQYWPPLLLATGATAPTSMTGVMGKWGVTMRADGGHQLTYDGAPLYTFANDKKPGQINGQGVAGAWWAVVAPGM